MKNDFKSFQRPCYDASSLGADCANCPLSHRNPVGPTYPVGNPKLIIIGESPNHDDNYLGRPFSGKTGKFLDEQLNKLEINKKDIMFTNAIACMPLKNMSKSKWKKAREACNKRLKHELSKYPEIPIVTMGEHAMQAVAPKSGSASAWFGYPLRGYDERWVMPNYSPTFAAFYRPELRNTFTTWLKRGVQLGRGEYKFFKWDNKKVLSVNDPSLQEAIINMSLSDTITIDIESIPGKNIITRMGLSNGEWTISLPWDKYDTKKWGDIPALNAIIKKQLTALIESKNLVAHNGQFDIVFLMQRGFKLKNGWGLVHDTLAGHAACNQQEPHDLGYVVTSSFNIPRYKTEFKALGNEKGSDRWIEVSESDMAEYNAGDAYVTWLEWKRQEQVMKDDTSAAARFTELMDLLAVTLKMKYYGWRVDGSALAKHRDKLAVIVADKEALIKKVAKGIGFSKIKKRKKKGDIELEFNPGSTKDIRTLFSKHFGVTAIKTNPETNEASFDGEVLTKLVAHPDEKVSLVSRLFLEYREHNKLLTSYANGKHIQTDGFYHPSWNPWGAISGRWSCHEPAVQTIPKTMRDIFIGSSQDKWIIECDYVGLEMVIAAYASGADLLCQWVEEDKDLHLETAKRIFKDENMSKKDIRRQACKTVNYSLLYGSGVENIYTRLKMEFPDITRAMVGHVYEETKRVHPKLNKFMLDTEEFAIKNRYTETLISGRRRYAFGDDTDMKELFNHVIQGTAADLTNRALVGIDKEIDWVDTKVLGQVHDALVLETTKIEKTTALLKKWMELPVNLCGVDRVFKTDLKVARSWAEEKK